MLDDNSRQAGILPPLRAVVAANLVTVLTGLAGAGNV
jgi:hypothetical protein